MCKIISVYATQFTRVNVFYTIYIVYHSVYGYIYLDNIVAKYSKTINYYFKVNEYKEISLTLFHYKNISH